MGLLLVIVAAAMAVFFADKICAAMARGRIHHSIDTLPTHGVGLVLGASKTLKNGQANLHFKHRIEAAAALYHSGKVRHLLVSGDNHTRGYDEPTDMLDALTAAGVPADAITRDHAGFRTLDSVIRAHTVFGLSRFIVVTENFHCSRAIWIARRHHLDAVAYAAPDVSNASWSLRAKARESLARVLCGIDLYLLNRSPKFPGPPEPIALSSTAP